MLQFRYPHHLCVASVLAVFVERHGHLFAFNAVENLGCILGKCFKCLLNGLDRLVDIHANLRYFGINCLFLLLHKIDEQFGFVARTWRLEICNGICRS